MDAEGPASGKTGRASFYSTIGVETERIDACLAAIGTPAIKPIAAAFSTNIQQACALGSLPIFLQLHAEVRQIELELLIEAGGKLKGPYNSRESIAEQLRNRQAELRAERRVADLAVARADNRLGELADTEQSCSDALSPLRSAVTSAAWTAFEVAASDSWVAALNTRPMVLGQAAFASAGEYEVEGLTAKQLSVGLLARFDFDLRSSLGTILKSKYDFTSVSGIRKAFVAAFGKPCEASLTCLQSRELQVLEAKRHLLVHRAGIVDSEYIRRTGSTSPLGSPLQLELDGLCIDLNPVIVAGCEVLTFVDGWLQTHPG